MRASVSSILLDESGTKAIGVQMTRTQQRIYAPLIISNAGYINTYGSLLPKSARTHVDIKQVISSAKSSLPITTGMYPTVQRNH